MFSVSWATPRLQNKMAKNKGNTRICFFVKVKKKPTLKGVG